MKQWVATVEEITSQNGVKTVTARGTAWPADQVYVWDNPLHTQHITEVGQQVFIRQCGGYYYPAGH